MSNIIEAMFNFGTVLTSTGLERDADRDALNDNLTAIAKARAYNKAVASAQGADALRRGAVEAGAIRMAGTQLEGQQRLAYAVGNVDASSGTAAQTIDSSRLYSELDAQTSSNNAVRAAMGFKEAASVRDDALAFQAREEMRGYRGRGAKRAAANFGAGTAVVGSVFDMATGGMGGMGGK
ncbi:MAG: hypothetical protein QM817_10325 [Archangium sp.]